MAKRPDRKTDSRVIPIKEVSTFSIGDEEILRQRIAEKAYGLYECRGCCHGHDLDDWLQAEQLVFAEIAAGKRQRKTMTTTEK